jgi:hypothetical protein
MPYSYSKQVNKRPRKLASGAFQKERTGEFQARQTLTPWRAFCASYGVSCGDASSPGWWWVNGRFGPAPVFPPMPTKRQPGVELQVAFSLLFQYKTVQLVNHYHAAEPVSKHFYCQNWPLVFITP